MKIFLSFLFLVATSPLLFGAEMSPENVPQSPEWLSNALWVDLKRANVDPEAVKKLIEEGAQPDSSHLEQAVAPGSFNSHTLDITRILIAHGAPVTPIAVAQTLASSDAQSFAVFRLLLEKGGAKYVECSPVVHALEKAQSAWKFAKVTPHVRATLEDKIALCQRVRNQQKAPTDVSILMRTITDGKYLFDVMQAIEALKSHSDSSRKMLEDTQYVQMLFRKIAETSAPTFIVTSGDFSRESDPALFKEQLQIAAAAVLNSAGTRSWLENYISGSEAKKQRASTILVRACAAHYPTIVAALLAAHSDPNARIPSMVKGIKNCTALEYAVARNSSESVDHLLQAGATGAQETFQWALDSGASFNIVKKLLQAGARPHPKALFDVIYCGPQATEEVVKELIARGVPVNAQDNNGKTVLEVAEFVQNTNGLDPAIILHLRTHPTSPASALIKS